MQASPSRAMRSIPAPQSQSSGRTNRRGFLSASAAATAVVTFGSTAPSLLRRAAAAAADEDRVLVVVEMAGGNDGLSTVIPIADPEYAKARPKLAIAAADTLRINDEFGLNSSLSGFADLLQQGHFAVVQGVGYENPNRSLHKFLPIETCLPQVGLTCLRRFSWTCLPAGRFLAGLEMTHCLLFNNNYFFSALVTI